MKASSAPYFSPELFRFLSQLASHNDRTWFQANKPRYEASVLQPSVRFVEAMGPRLAAISPHLVADARPFGGSVSRIYRDTRFSADKSPYRTNAGILFGHEMAPTTEEHLPGFYLHLEPGASFVASGSWRPSRAGLQAIREAIVSGLRGWDRVRAQSPPSGGESYARVPRGFSPDSKYADDLRRKDFYSSVPFRDAEITSPTFGRSFIQTCTRLEPLNRFLARAFQVPW
jgi:uncharacterized protein (TIGR02453 family)